MVDKTTRLVVDVEAQEAHPTAPCTDDTEDFGRTQKGQLRTYNVLDARAVQVQDQLFKFQVAAERVTVARARGDVRGGQGAAAGVARTQWSHDGGGLLDVPVYGRERDASDIHPFHGGTRAVPGGTDRDSASRASEGKTPRIPELAARGRGGAASAVGIRLPNGYVCTFLFLLC